ncbi:alpha-N-acetylglucosaminidase [Asticcacaulis endophyticus]|uniref:Alpha-N-acetylglucosaminidase n=1 Tax=Asticcacaulis endophyticus TaxID=1395890 RepID=A0A918UUN6_9CAUL|nr:alpha-N-acetylglucosaminidase [Asticcacaulis endophyticus]GGZ35436.1 alpha-N-acetylglucosaminidase [Asticcacaulis endophyticus]
MSGISRRQALMQTLAVAAFTTAPAFAAEDTTAAARAVLGRLMGKRAHDIKLKLTGGADSYFAVKSAKGAVAIEGSSPVALTRGAYAYLTSIGAANVSWEGNRVALPAALPAADTGKVATPFAHRVYMNTCTFGYTTPFWGWARWQKELDWMALHGIDMPLAMEGQEFVWQSLWRELGLSDTELGDYFSGPAFTPWHRMGNIEGYMAPVPQAWIEKKRVLQVKLLKSMRDLGMTPILPAFGGYVPKAFAQKHPEAGIYPMRPWEGFHETYWLDPADPLFAVIAKRFIELYTATYGEGQYYLADSFNEMLPPISKDGSDVKNAKYGDGTANTKETETVVDPALKAERLAAYGQAIYDSIRGANPDAVWVMQGWLFGADKHFWSADAIGAFLSKVPDDKLMILDIGNDRYPGVWQTTDAFQGKPWIYGYVHNYGASNPVYADLDFYKQDIGRLEGNPKTGALKGFGMFPEGLHNNSIAYEYCFDAAWGIGGGGGKGSVDDWIATYLKGRYGRTTPALLSAWGDYRRSVYTTKYWTPRWWNKAAGAYMVFKRPQAAITSFEGHPGDRALLHKAVTEFLSLKGFEGSQLYRHDVIDAVRHLASEEIDYLLMGIITDYQKGDLAAGDAKRAKFTDLMIMVDALLGDQPDTLSSWIDEARAYGDTKPESDYYVLNAKAQVTVWGGLGNLNDYASKAWQGMYKDFYLPRWTKLLAAVRQSAVTGKAFDQVAFTRDITAWEQAWVKTNATFTRRRPKDAFALSRQILKRQSEA